MPVTVQWCLEILYMETCDIAQQCPEVLHMSVIVQ